MNNNIDNDKLFNKGIFWVIDDELVYCSTPCDANGNPLEELARAAVSKSGTTYNHKLYWATLPKSVTRCKEYRYYPRGRVEVANGRAKLFLNPTICSDEIKSVIAEAYGFAETEIDMFADGSGHYRCLIESEDT